MCWCIENVNFERNEYVEAFRYGNWIRGYIQELSPDRVVFSPETDPYTCIFLHPSEVRKIPVSTFTFVRWKEIFMRDMKKDPNIKIIICKNQVKYQKVHRLMMYIFVYCFEKTKLCNETGQYVDSESYNDVTIL